MSDEEEEDEMQALRLEMWQQRLATCTGSKVGRRHAEHAVDRP